MKNKVITILLILNLITTTGILNFLIKGQISKEKEIIKEMTESEQVSGLQTQIDVLNESHEEYARNVQSYKRQIASAITDMGVDTLETGNAETMASNIRSIARDASSISYNNANSRLTSTNVQGAVDELSDSLVFYRKLFEADYSVAANGQTDVYFEMPEGYKALSIIYISTGTANVYPYVINNTHLYLKNTSNQTVNTKARMIVVLTKLDVVEM